MAVRALIHSHYSCYFRREEKSSAAASKNKAMKIARSICKGKELGVGTSGHWAAKDNETANDETTSCRQWQHTPCPAVLVYYIATDSLFCQGVKRAHKRLLHDSHLPRDQISKLAAVGEQAGATRL